MVIEKQTRYISRKKNSPSPASYNKQSEIVNDFINIIIIKLNYYY